MPIKVKQGGAYVDGSMYVKQTGAYVAGSVYAKVAGAYVAGGGGSTVAFRVMGEASVSATFANRTLALTMKSSVRAKRVRAHVFGIGASSGIKVSIASSNSAASVSVPSGGVGAFQQFVFSTDSHPAASIGSGSSSVPAVAVSEWLDFTPLDRTDGGSGFLYYLRTYENAVSAGNRSPMSQSALTDVDSYGWWAGLSSAGDFTAATASFSNNTSAAPVWLEFETDQAAKTVAWVGDSTDQGRDAYGLRTHSGARIAVDTLNATGKVIAPFNGGWSGSSTAGSSGAPPATISGYWAQFLATIEWATKKPDVVCFKPTSVNNTYFAWSVAQAEYWADTFVAWANANGVTPVLVTPCPVNSLTEAAETNRRACVTAIKAKAAAYGIACVDRDAVFTNYGVVTGGYTDGADTSDGTHLTAAGAEKEASNAWLPVLTSLV